MKVVFAGPSVAGLGDGCFAGVTLLPPAACGDLARAARDGAAAVGLVDGFFETRPSVWHKEILWALSRGVRIFGASSMGALRAAEMAPFGMCGVGRIFRLYRRGALGDDDEVALLHGPAETGFAPLTEAMVNIRFTLRAARRAGIVSAAAEQALVGAAKAIFYKDRTYEAVLGAVHGQPGLNRDELDRLGAWLPAGRRDAKREDALCLLSALQHAPAELAELRPNFPRTRFFDAFEARYLHRSEV